MGKSVVLGVLTMVVSFSVYECYIDCYNDDHINREGILGKNVTLRCYTSWVCNSVRWDFLRADNTVDGLERDQVQVGYNASFLTIFGIGFHNNGRYRCYCYTGSSPASPICSVTLKTICQATVRLNGRTIVYNSSLPNSPSIDVTAGQTISIECSEGVILGRRCAINPIPASDELSTYTFEVLQEHNSCLIKCRSMSGDEDPCIVGFTLKVTPLETSTSHSTTSTVSFHPSVNENVLTTTSTSNIPPDPRAVVTAVDKHSVNQNTSTIIPKWHYTTMPAVQWMEKDNAVPDKSGSFPVMLLTGISIVVFVGILFIICFFIYSLRSKSTSRQKKTQIPDNESPDTTIPIGPTYATVNKSSSGCTKDDDDSERGIPCTDDAYAEVNSVVKEESSAQQVNAIQAETSIAKDYYSVVNTSNTKLESTESGNKSDSALYTDVNKGVKQVGKKVGTVSPESSGCNPNVPGVQSYDVLERPESSEYDAVGVVSTSPALYAVVDKERKKE